MNPPALAELTRDLLATISVGSILGTAIFGATVGAIYGWRTAGSRDVQLLFWVVLGFFLMRAAYNLLTGAPVGAGRSLGGIVLWLIACLAMVLGRLGRIRFELWRSRRAARQARRRAQDGGPP